MKTQLKLLSSLVALLGLGTVAAQAETIHSVTQISYDVRNQPVCTAVRMNPTVYGSLPADACTLGTESVTYGPDRIVKNTYNAAGQLTQVDQAYATSVQRAYARYTYTVNGLKATEKDANGNLTTLEYDGFDRLKTLRYPSTTIGSGTSSAMDYEQYDYDSSGNRTYWRRRDGQVINDCFDTLNRIIVHYVHAQSGCTATGGAGDVYTSYDGLGRLASKRFASFSGSGVSYIYDSLGRVTSSTDMNGRTVGYSYNQASARVSLIYPDLNTVGYTLDNANRLSTIGWNATSGLFHQTYYNEGWISAQGKGNAITIYGFHSNGQLWALINDFNGTTNDIRWEFGYNPAGQIHSYTATSTAYDYDEQATATTNKTYDGLNRDTGIVSVGGYDARGNLTYEGTGGRTMTYDIENRLLTVNSPSANVKLEYDPEGRLYRYSTDGGANWTTYLYDGVNLIGEYAGSATLPLRRFIHGTGTDNPLVWLEGSGATNMRWFYTNYQGSIIGLADGNGVLTELYKYGPYGEPKDVNNADSWSGSRFRYTGQVILPEAKLYYYKARVYDPQMGRFLQTDPIGSEDDLNLYAYVAGDPVNGTDPTGEVAVNCTVTSGGGEQPTVTCDEPTDDGEDDVLTVHVTERKTNCSTPSNCNTFTYDRGSVRFTGFQPRFYAENLKRAVKMTTEVNPSNWTVALQGDSRSGRQDNNWVEQAAGTPPASADYWKSLRNCRSGIKIDENGNYCTYDRRHGEIEVFDRTGRHLGTKNAVTGQMEKPPVPGRRLNGL